MYAHNNLLFILKTSQQLNLHKPHAYGHMNEVCYFTLDTILCCQLDSGFFACNCNISYLQQKVFLNFISELHDMGIFTACYTKLRRYENACLNFFFEICIFFFYNKFDFCRLIIILLFLNSTYVSHNAVVKLEIQVSRDSYLRCVAMSKTQY